MQNDVIDDGGTASPLRAEIGARVRKRLDRNPMVSRIASEKLDIYGRQAFLSPQECAAMRDLIDADAQPSTLFSGSANADYRTSHSCNLNPWTPLVSGISDRISALLGIDASHGETLQGQRYTAGQQYKVHCDYFPVTANYWPAMLRSGGQRSWTAMIYLSDVAEGGETHFPMCEFMVPPKEGMILIWNNMDRNGAPEKASLHAAKPVISGTKYVVTKWYRERPWTPGNAG
ncbi:2OG-Fe(II) oxygenase [Sphingobium sp. SCG-1]|uniref:prolyl hydroxylase family protein n=1 Tax=Sphingobium sp. SCG-1 TaxID=2072936 RepID=UPI000CD6B103|nr:2OG-Fe(II) oxygenase [Sphingobium sp. SCG-1]AUW60355.1 2OG-Fe(II) oxygenase [Sphingobium sp. SCG-1]